MRDHFAVLGLELSAGEGEVKKAYRHLAKQWHPDKNRSPQAEEKFKEIGAAYDFLLSIDRREKLSRDIQREREAASRPKPAPQPSPTPQSQPRPGTSKKNRSPPERAEEARKKAHWSSSFTRKDKSEAKGSRFKAEWDSYGDSDDGVRRKPGASQKMPFSSAFTAFFEEVGSMFDDPSTFYGESEDFFDSFLSSASPSFTMGGKRSKPPPPRPRHVAPETGSAEGLDEEYLFSSPPRPSRPEAFGYADGAWSSRLCKFCQKSFPSQTAKESHEKTCSSRTFSFDDDDDEEWGEEEGDYWGWRGKVEDWRQTHENLLNKIRRDRRAFQRDNPASRMADTMACTRCGKLVATRDFVQHVTACVKLFRTHASQTGATEPGPSKSARAKEYASRVPKPGSWKTSGSGGNEGLGDLPEFSPFHQSGSGEQSSPRGSAAHTSTNSQPHDQARGSGNSGGQGRGQSKTTAPETPDSWNSE